MSTGEKIFYRAIIPILCVIIPLLVGWKPLAKFNEWIPKSECPGTPVTLSITSPGDKATAKLDHNRLQTKIVIKANRSIRSYDKIGLVFNYEKGGNHYVIFPDNEISKNQRNSIIDPYRGIGLPSFSRKKLEGIFIWAILVDDKATVGEDYANIDQISKIESTIAISSPIFIKFR